AVPIDTRLTPRERAPLADGAAVLVDEPLRAEAGRPRRRGRRAAASVGRVEHELSATAVVLHTSGTSTSSRPIELTYGNLLCCALTGGGPVPSALRERARAAGVPAALTYGLTEACSQVTTTPRALLEREGPVPGPPLFCVRAHIAAAVPEQDRIAEAPRERSQEGEILVAGPTVAPASRARDGWLHTGDLGFLDEQGRLHVTGRQADTIISGGE